MADINDILGNERVKEHFIAAVHHKKISHAYIIEGDKGSGKKMLAAAFSKILHLLINADEDLVAPLVGAWIEINSSAINAYTSRRRSPRGSVD